MFEYRVSTGEGISSRTIGVKAPTVTISMNGDVVFSDGEVIVRAFASGNWSDIALVS